MSLLLALAKAHSWPDSPSERAKICHTTMRGQPCLTGKRKNGKSAK